MAAKKRRRRKGPGLVWRILFGHNGPTKTELRKLWRQSFTKTFTLNVRDPQTGRVQKKRMRIGDDGRIQEAKAPAKKKRPAAKKAAAKAPAGRRGASQPSKPSRASRTGSVQRRQPAAVPPAVRTGHAAPMTERYLQGAGGRMAGSQSANPEQRQRKAEVELRAAIRAAQASAKSADQRAERLLG